MIAFLTSSPCGAYRKEESGPIPMNEANGFLRTLQQYWPEHARVLTISADPVATHINDSIELWYQELFPMSGLSYSELRTCDCRDETAVRELANYDVLILSGGHVPTQNAFFRKIGLKDAIRQFDGILIGISAGTMNCAETVYAQPELPGESADPNYRRFLPGLGLTDLMLLPHYQAIKDDILDGKRLMEDITYPDSMEHVFYAIPDGSYVLLRDGTQTVFGECQCIHNGILQTVCSDGSSALL